MTVAKLPDYWPAGAAYQTPRPPPELAPICPKCSARHAGPTINCNLTNAPQEPIDHADATD